MPQPKDYADSWNPYKTDPGYQPRLTEIGDQPPDAIDQRSEPDDEQTDKGRDDPAFERRPERPFSKPAPKLPDFSQCENSMWKRLFDFLVPLDDPWRLVVGFAVFFLIVNSAASRGWLTVIGLSQFASAESVTEIKLGLIEGQIFETVKAHCTAPTLDSKLFYSRRRNELLKNYESAAGKPYTPIPTCKDLGIREIEVAN